MAVVIMVRERVAATPNHYFDIYGGFGGSAVGEIWSWRSGIDSEGSIEFMMMVPYPPG
jgi:hypothetical protein